MNNFDIERQGDSVLIRFSEARVPMMERVAVVDFETFRSLVFNFPVVRSAIYCFLVIESGEVELEINGISKTVGRDRLVCVIPGDSCRWKGSKDLSARFICFEGPFLTAVLTGGFTLEPVAYLNPTTHYPFIRLSEKRQRKLLSLTDEMQETLDERPVFFDLLRCQLWQFVFLAEKEYMANQNPEGRQLNAPNHVGNFIRLVNKHFRTAHDAKFYAEKMHISPNYLNKIAKTSLGVSAHDYIMNHVMSEAKILLRLTDVSVKELASDLGFDDPNYFIRCFKKAEGITPGEYRDRGSL